MMHFAIISYVGELDPKAPFVAAQFVGEFFDCTVSPVAGSWRTRAGEIEVDHGVRIEAFDVDPERFASCARTLGFLWNQAAVVVGSIPAEAEVRYTTDEKE